MLSMEKRARAKGLPSRGLSCIYQKKFIKRLDKAERLCYTIINIEYH